MPKIGTLVTERTGDGEICLCATDGHQSEVLARFTSEEAVRRFNELFALARSVSYAQGKMGI